MKRIAVLIWLLSLSTSGLLSQASRRLDTTSMAVLGGAWSAGFGDWQLQAEIQKSAYPTLLAEAVGTIKPQPLFRPLVGPNLIGLDPLPGSLPPSGQSVLRALPFPLFAFNLSIPWIKAADSLALRPSLPLVQERDFRQTMVNLVLGYPHLILEQGPSWSQLEYAERMRPTFVLLELGLGDVQAGAITGNPAEITAPSAFAGAFSEISRRLAGTYAEVVVATVPNPLDTPFFLDLTTVSALTGIPVGDLKASFGFVEGDRVTPSGLVQIGDTLAGRRPPLLTADARLPAGLALQVEATVDAYNSTIRSQAAQHRFLVWDLHALAREVRVSGVAAGVRHLTATPEGGFYSPDWLFPSPTGHAVLANRLISLLNSSYGRNFPAVDVDAAAAGDPFASGQVTTPTSQETGAPWLLRGFPVKPGSRGQEGIQ